MNQQEPRRIRIPQWLAGVPADVRVACRRLLRRPGFTLSALLVFGLGIGFSTAIIGLYRALFLRPLPYADPDRLVAIVTTFRDPTQPSDEFAASGVDLLRWPEARTLASLGASTPRDVGVLIGDRVESLKAEAVSAGLWTTLGVPPALGRVFRAEEDAVGADVVVLSDGLWRRLGARPSLVGEALRIDGRPHTILGVLPPGFGTFLQPSELYLPLGISPAAPGAPGRRVNAVTARLAAGVSPERADAELAGIAKHLADELPDSHRGWGVRVKSLREQRFGDQRPLFRLLLSGVALVLVIGCANLAHLSLANSAARRGEFALRRTLGARALDLWREEGVESLLLAVAGAALGLGLAAIATRTMLGLNGNLALLAGDVRMDGTLALSALLSGVVAALLSSAVPTLWAGRGKAGHGAGIRVAGGRGDRILRQLLLAGEVGLSLILLVGGAVLVRGLVTAMREDPGFRPEQLVAAEVVLPADRYAAAPARQQFVARLLEALRSAPGVTAASVTMTRFRPNTSMQTSVAIEGQAGDPSAPNSVHFRRIAPAYVSAMGARLVSGREFTEGDGPDAPKVALVSQSMARRFWPGAEAVGRRFKRPPNSPDWVTVVGVLADARDAGSGFDLGATLFVPYAQNNVAGVSWSPVTLVVRSAAPVSATAALVRQSVKTLDPDLAVEPPAAVADQMAGALAPARFQAILVGGFALTALLLAIAGLYGVTSYGVAQQRREIGIRMALGAEGSGVVSLVLRQALRPLVAGLAAGALGSIWVTTLAGRLLPRAAGFDPGAVVGASMLLAAVGVVAALAPARRASRIAPSIALRE